MRSEAQTSRNIIRLYGYNFFTALAITIAASFVFLDKLLLRLAIDPTRFGVIKGCMFMASAVLYMAFTPLLQKKPGHADKFICVWAYLFRSALPALLPVLALFTLDQEILTWAAIILLSLGMTLAAFANNSLMSLYRLVLPEEHFNHRVGTMNLLISLPASLLALAVAYILDRYEGAELREFLIVFAGLQVICILFEVPGMVLMKRLELPGKVLRPHHHVPNGFWKPWLDRNYIPVMLMVLFHGFVAGSWSTYLNVYLMNEMGFSMSLLTTISLFMSLLLTATLPFTGQITDRIGYKRMFLILSSGCLIGGILFCSFPGRIWVLFPFAILLWGGTLSLFSGSFSYGLYAAGSKLARNSLTTCYISAFGVCRNGGIFLGSLFASLIYGAIAPHCSGATLYIRYFWSVLPFPVLLFIATLIYRFTGSDGTSQKK